MLHDRTPALQQIKFSTFIQRTSLPLVMTMRMKTGEKTRRKVAARAPARRIRRRTPPGPSSSSTSYLNALSTVCSVDFTNRNVFRTLGSEKGKLKKTSKKRDKIKPRKRIEGEGEEEGGEEGEGGWEKVKYGVPLVKVNIWKDAAN